MTEANKMRQHLLVDECALLDLASSACQEAISFGVNENVFERLARSVELKCQDGMPAAARDVVSERQRQVSDEGYQPSRDDVYRNKELAHAAACYALIPPAEEGRTPNCPPLWPWPTASWKPRGRRENLVRAGALILAEIERIDRSLKDAKP